MASKKFISMIVAVIIVIIAASSVVYYTSAHHNSKVNITVSEVFSPTEFQAFMSARNAFMAEHPNVTIGWINESEISTSTYIPYAIEHKAPNVYIGSSGSSGILGQDGFLLNLTPYVNQSYLSGFVSSALAQTTYNNTLYGLPADINGEALIYNNSMVPNPPQTTNQLISLAKNLTQESNGKFTRIGFYYDIGATSGYRFAAWQAAFGGRIFNLSSGLPTVNTSATVNALTFLNNFTTKYGISPPSQPEGAPGSNGIQTVINLFSEGKIGMIMDGPWDMPTYLKALGDNVSVAPLPVVSQTGLRPLPFVGAHGYFVSNSVASGATKAQLTYSAEFVKYLASTSSQLLFWNASKDIPSTVGGLNYVESLNISWLNGFINQWEDYGQPSVNLPQMSYYWPAYLTAVSSYVSGGQSAQTTANQIQSSIVSEMQKNNVSPYISLNSNYYITSLNSVVVHSLQNRETNNIMDMLFLNPLGKRSL